MLCAVFSFSALNAQTDTADKGYRVTENDPSLIKDFKLHAILIGADFQLGNITVGAGGQFNLLLMDKLMLEGQGRISYYDKNNHREMDLKSGPVNMFYYLEGGAEYYIFDRIVNRSIPVVLEDDKYASDADEIYIRARQVMGPRLGYLYGFGSIRGNMMTPLTSPDRPQGFLPAKDYVSHLTSSAVYLGFMTKRYDYVRIDAGKMGNRQKARVRMYFADVMYGSTELEPMTIRDSVQTYDLSNMPMTNLGFRIGGQSFHNRNYTRMELGMRPGVTGLNPYISISLGMTIIGAEPRPKNKTLKELEGE